MNFEFCEELENKYLIDFDTDKLPLDFEKWKIFDVEKIKKSTNNPLIEFVFGEYYLSLENFDYVVVESIVDNFKIKYGNTFYLIEKGRKYLPILSIHKFKIRITNDIKIYTDQNNTTNVTTNSNIKYNQINVFHQIYNYNKNNNELFNLLRNYSIRLNNFNIIFETTHNNFNLEINKFKKTFLFIHGTIIYSNDKYIKINENEFYYDIVKYKNDKNLNEINLFDKYIQYDFIKIYKFY